MARWRYLAERLTGDGAGEVFDISLPLENVELENVFSGHNSLSGTISPEVGRLMAPDGSPLLLDWGTAIWAESDGNIHGGGILASHDRNGPDIDIDVVGMTGYLQDLPYTDAWFGVEIDPLDVVRHIWDHAQGKPGGNLGLQVADLKTGVKIGTTKKQGSFDTENGPLEFEAGPIRLAWYQTPDMAAQIDELAESTPFDYRERHQWDGGDRLEHHLDFGYPTIGRLREDLRFVIGENVAPPSRSGTGEQYANEILMLGSGEGRKMKRGSASRPRDGRLRRVASVSDSSLRSQKQVDARANTEAALRASDGSITEIEVADTKHAPLGSYRAGDEIYLEGPMEWGDVGLRVRIMSVRMAPSDPNATRLGIQATNALAS